MMYIVFLTAIGVAAAELPVRTAGDALLQVAEEKHKKKSTENTVPRELVIAKMTAFVDNYNADNTEEAAEVWAEQSSVKVNNGDAFAGTTRAHAAAFLGFLRNALGGTNMRMVVTSLEGNVHVDRWVADNGAGSCTATWEQNAEGEWFITNDDIQFTPRLPPTGTSEDGNVPHETVISKMTAFVDNYNEDNTGLAASVWAEENDVKVNNGSVFAGTTQTAAAAFLDTLRNSYGGTNMAMAVTGLNGNVHVDQWVADNGAGSCTATWQQNEAGEWEITSDVIQFIPKLS